MYRLLKNKHKDVWLFYLINSSEIIYVGKESIDGIHRNLYINGKVVRPNFNGSIKLRNQTFFNLIISFEQNFEVFKIGKGHFENIHSFNHIRYLSSKNNGVFYKRLLDFSTSNGYGSLVKNEFDFTFDKQINGLSIYEEKAYYICFNEDNQSSVSCFSPEKVDYSWHFNLENLKMTHSNQMLKYGEFQMKINHFVGVVHGILWIDVDVIMNGSFLLGLDAESGKCVHLLDTVENQNEVNYVALIPNRLPGSTFTTYDDKRNILFGFAHDHFHWQVDLSEKSPKIKMWSVEDEMKKHHAFVSAFMNCGISDSHIFFPVGSIGSTPQVFALNRENLKVDWQYFLTEGGAYYTPTKVEVTETHLYVLDNTGTLHIFEKTKDN